MIDERALEFAEQVGLLVDTVPGYEQAAAYQTCNFVNCDFGEDGGQLQEEALAKLFGLPVLPPRGAAVFFGLGGTAAEKHPGRPDSC